MGQKHKHYDQVKPINVNISQEKKYDHTVKAELQNKLNLLILHQVKIQKSKQKQLKTEKKIYWNLKNLKPNSQLDNSSKDFIFENKQFNSKEFDKQKKNFIEIKCSIKDKKYMFLQNIKQDLLFDMMLSVDNRYSK